MQSMVEILIQAELIEESTLKTKRMGFTKDVAAPHPLHP